MPYVLPPRTPARAKCKPTGEFAGEAELGDALGQHRAVDVQDRYFASRQSCHDYNIIARKKQSREKKKKKTRQEAPEFVDNAGQSITTTVVVYSNSSTSSCSCKYNSGYIHACIHTSCCTCSVSTIQTVERRQQERARTRRHDPLFVRTTEARYTLAEDTVVVAGVAACTGSLGLNVAHVATDVWCRRVLP